MTSKNLHSYIKLTVFTLVVIFCFFLKVYSQANASIAADFYKPKVDFATGPDPYINAIGDIDGDGKPDMVVANSSSNTISVLRNTSNPGIINTSSFANKMDFATGMGPVFVAISDLDGDGKQDVTVANISSNTISLLRNTSTPGNISFADKIDFATGYQPYSLAIGDLDGDGKADIVVANITANTISLYRNTSTSGSITSTSFTNRIDVPMSGGPSLIQIKDVDADGKPDLVIAATNSLAVLRNTSSVGIINSSSFAPEVDFAAGSYPFSVAVGDVDGDGKPDLAVTNVNSNTVSVFRNLSTPGTIDASSFASKVDFATGAHPPAMAIGDVNGDGKLDMVVANQLSNSISVLRNTATSGSIDATSFADKVDFTTGAEPLCVTISDIDGDQIPEIAVTNLRSNTVSVFQRKIIPPPTTKWAKHPDGHLAPYTYPAISSDGDGNTYVTGGFDGTLTFPTLPSPTVLTSAGEADVFIAKYDAAGKVIWAKRTGGSHSEVAYAIKYDGFGNIYIAGNYSTSTDFEGTIFTNSVTSASNVFIAKYNASTGNMLWVKQGATTSCCVDQSAFAIAVDKSGNAYLTGGFSNITFYPLPKMYALGSSEDNGGWPDIFVVKYNSDGVPQWQTSAGSYEPSHYYNFEQGKGIDLDESGNVYVTGSFNGSSTNATHFGSIDLISNGGGGFDEGNFFLAKYNQSTFSWEWAVQGGGNANDYGKNVSLDNQGNLYVSGYFEGTGTFGSTTLTSTGDKDYFFSKYSANGNQVWTHSVEGVGSYDLTTSRVNGNGHFYFAGTFGGTVTVGGQTLTSNGYENFYVSAWNSNGDFEWVKHIPGDYFSLIGSLEIEDNGNIDITTVFAGSETFDCTAFGSGTYADLAIAKLGFNNGTAAPTIHASANNICTGNNTTLSIADGDLNNATDWKWYTGSCGGSLIGSGSSITVSPTENTTYYVRSEGGCSGPGNCGSITISVNNTAPVINSVTGPVAPIAVNNSINLNVVYTGANITTAKIKWDDVSAEQVITNPASNLTVPHTYNSPGVYTVTVSLIDACNHTTSTGYQYVVIYDPNGGFVTGGGWINSPAGAYRADVTLTGKAIFGFESKYQKGATIPGGNTEFKFQAGNMNFKSSNYEWLVVSGSKAQFKGSGIINGSGSYGFILSAVDGNLNTQATPDLFRIKIWDKNNNDAIVYDNQYGAADNGALNTEIGGGSIIIHNPKPGEASSSRYTGSSQEVYSGSLMVAAFPNPSINYFTIISKSGSLQPLTITVTDILGRIVEKLDKIPANNTFTFGKKYRSGVYFAEVIQDDKKQIIKLVKGSQ